MNTKGREDTTRANTTLNIFADDVASPQAIIHALYAAISGPAGERDWGRIRNLYLEGARLIPSGLRVNGDNGLKILTIEQWIDGARPLFADKGFYEVEVARQLEEFGQIAHAFSTYEARWEADGEAFMRGINSIQMLRKEGRWWILTVFWDNASAENPIPLRYLPHPGDT